MDIQIIEKDSFCVMGKEGRGPADQGGSWIPPLWQTAFGNADALLPFAKYGVDGSVGVWGAMSDVDRAFQPWGQEGLYLAGLECLRTAEPPQGFVKWRIPGFRYLVVALTQPRYGEVFAHIMNEYLPTQGFSLAGAVHERYPRPEQSEFLELWFPIERLDS